MTLFDPDPSAGPRRVSLVKLSGELARAAAAIGRVSVEGEVVRPRTLPSGRIFFTLRDRAAQIDVTVPGSRARRCRAVHGERVCVTGTVGYAADRGRVSFSAEEVVPVGAGAIAALLEEVRARLRAEGLLERRRRPLPLLPRAVGVVCGADAAVRADIESVVAARFPGYPLRFREVGVSGPGAAEAVAGGLRALLADPEVDVVILARGGGDAAQLLPFSDEELCRAVCAARVPVVTAIGHEGDRPLCDEVADLRCATPSLAAAAVIPSRAELEAHLDGLLERADPSRRVGESLRLLERIDRESGLAHRLARADGQLSDRRRTLDALDPARVLQRGYAVVRDVRGAVVRDAAAVADGDALDVELARGRLAVEVRSAGP